MKIRNEFIIETVIRWNFIDILYLLLETKKINIEELKKITNKYILNNKIIDLINEKYPKINENQNHFIKICC